MDLSQIENEISSRIISFLLHVSKKIINLKEKYETVIDNIRFLRVRGKVTSVHSGLGSVYYQLDGHRFCFIVDIPPTVVPPAISVSLISPTRNHHCTEEYNQLKGPGGDFHGLKLTLAELWEFLHPDGQKTPDPDSSLMVVNEVGKFTLYTLSDVVE